MATKKPVNKKVVKKDNHVDKVERKILAPASEAHRKFLNCKSNFVIFGGGKLCASTLKTTS